VRSAIVKNKSVFSLGVGKTRGLNGNNSGKIHVLPFFILTTKGPSNLWSPWSPCFTNTEFLWMLLQEV
jgi:hypothetical protein